MKLSNQDTQNLENILATATIGGIAYLCGGYSIGSASTAATGGPVCIIGGCGTLASGTGGGTGGAVCGCCHAEPL